MNFPMTETDVTALRLGSFLSILVLMNVVEWLSPRRRWTVRRFPRLSSNYALVVINSFAIRFLLPLTAVAASEYAEDNELGILHWMSLPPLLNTAVSIILLDLLIYAQHVAFHMVPLFWRIHKVHHADLDIDVSTGLRFHTLEIWVSMWIKIGAVILLGANVWGVVLFEIILNGMAMFNHSNIRLPVAFDRWLRRILVTPDMHRVHHSTIKRETNSNYGFNLSLWDRLFRTYIDQPEHGHLEMEIGLSEYRDEKNADRIPGMIMMPLKSSSPAGTVSAE